ncbi:hypothetical protein [Roseateles amylovorans]|uniref:Peptidase C39 domain-containing protein n=1 Tax=Roseateles amylovorans TaxID=2978473 RepID=A0ABY6ATN0_9BURK|nr:hypothetical protein [Roseateles amylovorans]UXH76377.1 hypothetical protein N4261_15055 [Roseateles amylovorans]
MAGSSMFCAAAVGRGEVKTGTRVGEASCDTFRREAGGARRTAVHRFASAGGLGLAWRHHVAGQTSSQLRRSSYRCRNTQAIDPMKISSSTKESGLHPSGGASSATPSATHTPARTSASGEGPLGQLKARDASPSQSSASRVRAELPGSNVAFGARHHSHHSSSRHGSSHTHHSQQPQYSQPQYSQPQYSQPQYAQPQYAQQPAAAQTTPFHAGTQNDCSLHTIAAMTGWSERQVVQSLGLTQQQVQHISAYGMQPQDFTAALTHLNGNNGSVHHRQGSPSSLAASLPHLQDGGQFALGIERNNGIGHLVTAQRAGDQLVVTDRQSGQRMTFSSQQELQNYLAQSGTSRVHTWYNQ